MKYRNENYHFPSSEPALSVLSGVLQGLKDPMNSIDGSIQLLKMGKMEEYERFVEADYPTRPDTNIRVTNDHLTPGT